MLRLLTFVAFLSSGLLDQQLAVILDTEDSGGCASHAGG